MSDERDTLECSCCRADFYVDDIFECAGCGASICESCARLDWNGNDVCTECPADELDDDSDEDLE